MHRRTCFYLSYRKLFWLVIPLGLLFTSCNKVVFSPILETRAYFQEQDNNPNDKLAQTRSMKEKIDSCKCFNITEGECGRLLSKAKTLNAMRSINSYAQPSSDCNYRFKACIIQPESCIKLFSKAGGVNCSGCVPELNGLLRNYILTPLIDNVKQYEYELRSKEGNILIGESRPSVPNSQLIINDNFRLIQFQNVNKKFKRSDANLVIKQTMVDGREIIRTLDLK